MSADDLLAKAVRAAQSARILLDQGDADGACNRAYYAMFDAARSLLAPHPVDSKTHRGVLQLFSEKFVKTGVIPVEAGRSLKRAETSRYIADYEGQGMGLPEAAALVREAEQFVSLVQQVHAQGSAAP